MRYDCASASVAKWINCLAKKVGLTGSVFTATLQTTAEQTAALSPVASDAESVVDKTEPSRECAPAAGTEAQLASARASASELTQVASPEPPPTPEPETAEAAAERERRYREIFGIEEQKPRRRWLG